MYKSIKLELTLIFIEIIFCDFVGGGDEYACIYIYFFLKVDYRMVIEIS